MQGRRWLRVLNATVAAVPGAVPTVAATGVGAAPCVPADDAVALKRLPPPGDPRIREAAVAARAPEAARPVLDRMRATRTEDAALSRLAERLEGMAL